MLLAALRRIAAAGAMLAAAFCAHAQETAVPALTGHVVDLTSTLDAGQRTALEAKLTGFEREHGSQVVVLLVPTLGTETIEEFAGRVTDKWQLGRKGVDDGVLFVVAKNDRKMRIHTGRGVQGTLTDALSKRIVADLVAPHFRTGDFAGGIDAGVDAIVMAVEGESLPLPEHRAAPHGGASSSGSDLLYLGFVLVPIAGLILRGIFGRFFGATFTSGLTAVAVWLVLGSLGIAVVAAIAAFVFTLVSGSGLGRAVGGRGWGGGYIPGGWGGGGFGGGGGGGFSGGGGSFDGGGASGSW